MTSQSLKLITTAGATLGVTSYGLIRYLRYRLGGAPGVSNPFHHRRFEQGFTAVVTGGNTGLGLETVRELARAGAHVVIASRNATKAQRAVDDVRDSTGGSVEFIVLDLADSASIDDFATEFLEKHDRLDLLVNNAGLITYERETVDGGRFEKMMGVNHFGHFRLTMRLMDVLRKSGTKEEPSRVINVSSTGHKFSDIDFDDINTEKEGAFEKHRYHGYGNSKMANILFARGLNDRGDGVVVAASCHPGLVASELGRNSVGLRGFIFHTLQAIVGRSTAQGAQTTLYLSMAPANEVEWGMYHAECQAIKQLTHERDFFPFTAKPVRAEDVDRLWQISEESLEA